MDFTYEPGTFYKKIDNQLVAEVTFTVDDGIVSINHTLVNDAYRGQGIAKQLMLKVVQYAQDNHFKILPVCSYAIKFFEHTNKYNDLLK
ncbi:N-acetyltransferase [Apilactobacillus sp. TMW 2.2459]|uniref:GNAT family N-acetyltransferase n=1 Tax=Apilactobacillus xinyiensis TaxID=2841032 RepID=UPI00200DBA79|nr:GNAT family N-acetyltransferase [Apilactobacillus xinyiensis]MCL0312306.1 N-acetyltransferase [Apilactobacillus xinyiensis]